MRVFMFPGQGSQFKGMGKDLFRRYSELTQAANDELGFAIDELCVSDPCEVLSQTEYTQPALFFVNALSYLDHRDRTGESAEYLVGHSLGEYTALFAAGAFDLITGLKLVRRRGELMSQAQSGAMAAVLNIDADAVNEVLHSAGSSGIDVANLNSPKQTIISGPKGLIEQIRGEFESRGARYMPLKVSAAFHSRLMQQTQMEFRSFVHEFEFHSLNVDVIANCTARPYAKDNYVELMVEQITQPVRWSESISWLLAQESETAFSELGPGNVLARLLVDIKKSPVPLGVETGVSPGLTPAKTKGDRPGERLEHQFVPSQNNDVSEKPIVFLYGGQGTQYFHMGSELYANNAVFRNAFDECAGLVDSLSQINLVDELFGREATFDVLDDTHISHPALFSFAFALTECLADHGLRPDAALGYSLGEYNALVCAGMLDLSDGIALVTQQARLLREQCDEGGLLTILAPLTDYEDNAEDYAGCSLACVNSQNNFVISGSRERLESVASRLMKRKLLVHRLPVRHAFHSNEIDKISSEFVRFASKITSRGPQIAVYSVANQSRLRHFDCDYLWRVVREPVQFESMVNELHKSLNPTFVDLSATGFMAASIRRSLGVGADSHVSINQYGRNRESIDRLVSNLNLTSSSHSQMSRTTRAFTAQDGAR